MPRRQSPEAKQNFTSQEARQEGAPHDGEKVLAYVTGRLPEEERGAMEGHFIECQTCFNHAAKGLGVRAVHGEFEDQEFSPKGTCPESSMDFVTLAGVNENVKPLPERTARKLREHVLSCPDCQRLYYEAVTDLPGSTEEAEHAAAAN